MSGSEYLIDTSIIIDVLKSKTDVADRINKLSNYSINAIIFGELLTGVYGATNKVKQLGGINAFLKDSKVLAVDNITSDFYGQISAELRKKGKPIPSSDVWIAASAKQHGLTLITKDKHFAEIEGLDVEFW